MAVNLSDIAAMGARPTQAFVTIGIRGDTLISNLEARSIRVEHAEVRHASSTEGGRWTDQGSEARHRGDGNERQAWERPEWSNAAALEPPRGRNRVQSAEQLLDVVV